MPYCEKMRELKAKHGVTYGQWAEMSNVPEGTIKSICAGTTENANFGTMCSLIAALNESIDEFYHGHPAAAGSEEVKKDAAPNEQHHYHHFHIMSMRGDMREMAKEAMTAVYSAEAHKNAQNNLAWWRGIALAELVFIGAVMIIDILNPEIGWVRQLAAILQSSQGISGFVHRFFV